MAEEKKQPLKKSAADQVNGFLTRKPETADKPTAKPEELDSEWANFVADKKSAPTPVKKTKKTTKAAAETDDSTVLADIMQKEKKKRRKKIIIITAIILGVCAIIAITALYYFNQIDPFAEEKIGLKIEGPNKAIVGEEITYKISYTNQGEIDIKNAKLIFQKPNGLDILQTDPETQGSSWDLGEVKAGQQGEVEISGTIIDNFDTEQKLAAKLLFFPANFNSEFSVEQTFSTALEPIEVLMDLETEENITLGEKLNLTLKLTSEALDPINKIKINLIKPEGFNISSAEPKLETENSAWEIIDFAPTTEQEIKIEGSFDSNLDFDDEDDRLKEFKFELYYPNQEDQYFLQHELVKPIKIVDQQLVTYLIVNGSTENKNVSLGDKLYFSLIYKNKSDKEYNDLTLKTTINASKDILDWEDLEDEEYGKIEKTATGKTITWTKQQIPELEKITANAEKTIEFTIPIKSVANLGNINITELGKDVVETYSQLILKDASGEELPSIDSSKIYLSLNSNTQLGNRVLYYNEGGEQVGEGPLPPVAGDKTRYVVFWDITNKMHEITDIKVTSSLPDNVAWVNEHIISTGEINYNNSAKEITWSINRLPLSAEKASLSFKIELSPAEADIGKLMKLLNNTILTATDTVTDDTITITSGILTTNLDEDDHGVGQGIILRQAE